MSQIQSSDEEILSITIAGNGHVTKTFWQQEPDNGIFHLFFIRKCLERAFLKRIYNTDLDTIDTLLSQAFDDGRWKTIKYEINPEPWCTERLIDQLFIPEVTYIVTIEWVLVEVPS